MLTSLRGDEADRGRDRLLPDQRHACIEQQQQARQDQHRREVDHESTQPSPWSRSHPGGGQDAVGHRVRRSAAESRFGAAERPRSRVRDRAPDRHRHLLGRGWRASTTSTPARREHAAEEHAPLEHRQRRDHVPGDQQGRGPRGVHRPVSRAWSRNRGQRRPPAAAPRASAAPAPRAARGDRALSASSHRCSAGTSSAAANGFRNQIATVTAHITSSSGAGGAADRALGVSGAARARREAHHERTERERGDERDRRREQHHDRPGAVNRHRPGARPARAVRPRASRPVARRGSRATPSANGTAASSTARTQRQTRYPRRKARASRVDRRQQHRDHQREHEHRDRPARDDLVVEQDVRRRPPEPSARC